MMVPLRVDALSARLRDLGLATPQQLEQAKQELVSTQERFSAILVRLGLLRDPDAGKRLAPQLGAVPQRLDAPPTRTSAGTLVPAAMWRTHRLIPLREVEGKLLLATDDPFSVFAVDFFAQRVGCPVEAILLQEQDVASLAETFEQSQPSATASASPPHAPSPTAPPSPTTPTPPAAPKPTIPQPPPGTARPETIVGLSAGAATLRNPAARSTATPAPAAVSAQAPVTADAGDEPIIQLVDSMLAEAVNMRASDVHIEPGAAQVRVRYRVDGVLHDVNSPPKALQGPIVSRIKIMAGLNIAEKRLPQDGRFQITVQKRPLDLRVSTLPAMHGESIVMRLLDRSQSIRGLLEMGLSSDLQQQWETLIRRPHGMVLVTGPTGSGKTTTLYGALSTLNQPDRKLITVEDPIEYQLSGVNQVLVKASIGLTFAAGLRSMLRQAPDVIMVGEIRDQETAQVAIQAALTGHLVLSTLHTNDAPSAVTRLIDMGIAPFLVASTVQGVLAQRLVRRICPECRITDNATPEERAFLGEPELPQVIRSNGCDRCHGSGFLGRIGLFEFFLMSDALRKLVVQKASASVLRAQARREGMRGLRDDGILKIREGVTTMVEVLRVVAGGEG